MFSITTIASSTTKPLAIASAMSDRLSSEKPARYMMAQVPISETGTATAGMNVARTLRRKTKTTPITSNTEMISVRSISDTEARMVSVRSRIVIRCSPRGIVACSDGMAAFDQIHGRDDVGARLAEDDHVDRGLAVEEAGLPHGLLRVDHVGDVLEPDDAAVVIADNQAACSRRPSRSDRWRRYRRSRCRWRTVLWPGSNSGRPPPAARSAG